MSNLTIQITRGREIESIHQVDAVAVVSKQDSSAKADQQIQFGETDRSLFPRSAIKSLQALPIFHTGADQVFDLDEQEIALACASHTGQKIHTDKVIAWLNRMELSPNDLECGRHNPYDEKAYTEIIRSDIQPYSVHNNCSGKHTGMLAVSLQLNAHTKNYIHISHPVQQLVLETLKEICALNNYQNNFGVDGCSIPTHHMPLKNLALGMARLATGYEGTFVTSNACKKIFQACVNEPIYMSGEGEYCYKIMKALNKKVLVKVGAEGVMAAAIPELSMGIMLKSRDGSERAAQFAMSLLLEEVGLLPRGSEYTNVEIKNRNGLVTGMITGKISGMTSGKIS